MSNYTPAIRPSAAVSAAPAPAPMLALMDPAQFDQMQRVGKMLALSPLFPEHLRKGSEAEKIANGVLVMNMAVRLHEDPLTVAQNIYFVGGRPGWNTTYMIAKANMHGVFKDPIDWDVTGKGDALSVTAFAVLTGTGKRVQMTADMEMAKAEGWTRNTKYKSIPETMLRYRSASALIRMYCPEVMIGIPAGIEIETEMRDVTPRHAQEVERQIEEAGTSSDVIEEAEQVDAETGEVTPAPQKAAETKPEQGKATQQQQQRSSTKAADHTDQKPHSQRQQRNNSRDQQPQGGLALGGGAPSLSERLQMLNDSISDNLQDGADLESTLEMFELQLASIRQEAPDEYEAMIEDFRKFVADRDA